MYYCHDCKTKFSAPAKIIEKHGLTSPPFETICVCPNCKSQNYEKEPTHYCHCCGIKLSNTKNKYCSSDCKYKATKLFRKEKDYKQQQLESPVYTAVRAVDSYNRSHNSKFSYGQFFATVGKKKKGAQKNG
ncbi:MAG: hypothetical protein E7537_05665 [Ruminococcaceae bacterium]|nr:hypothetical protein [Oscillospiraceae bacterium]